MTLKELIMKVCFDELLPYLKEHEKERLDDIYSFREAYDLLRCMKPASGYKGIIRVEWSGGGNGWRRKMDLRGADARL